MSRRWSLRMAARIAADMVVVAVGIKPNAEIAAAAGLAVNRGIVVDDHLSTQHRRCFRDRRMRRASRRLLRTGRAGQRAGARAGRAARRTQRDVRRQRQRHQSQGLRGPRVLRRRFSRRSGHGIDRVRRSAASVPTRSWSLPTDASSAPCSSAIRRDALWYLDLIRAGAAIESFREDLDLRSRAGRAARGVRPIPRPTDKTAS